MAALKTIELELEGIKNLALISSRDDSVWLVVPDAPHAQGATQVNQSDPGAG